MSEISKRLEQILNSAIAKNPIIPVKTANGILVGDILIVNDGTIKHIWKGSELKYKSVYLNSTAIALANLLVKNPQNIKIDKIYQADQEYGRWYVDSQILRSQYEKFKKNQDYERSDMLWARYCESRDRAIKAKKEAECLATL